MAVSTNEIRATTRGNDQENTEDEGEWCVHKVYKKGGNKTKKAEGNEITKTSSYRRCDII